MNTNKTTKKLVYIGMLSAIAFGFYFLEVSIGFLFPAAPFLKIDFSDLPAYVGAVGLGPVSGIVIEAIKNILHISITKEPAFSGEIGNFLAGVAMILPASLILRKKFNWKGILLSICIGTLCATAVMAFANYFITLPLYGINDHAAKMSMIYAAFIPFNILKGVVISILSILVYRALRGKIFKN